MNLLRSTPAIDPATIALVPLALILPTEHHYPAHAQALAADMRRQRLWHVPIVVDQDSHAVMDGHHRLAAAHLLGLAVAPCLRLDYAQVSVTATRDGYRVDPDEIVRRALTAEPYPPKTTRHAFARPLPLCNLSLCLLEPGAATPGRDHPFAL
jgi:hypothetical protein